MKSGKSKNKRHSAPRKHKVRNQPLTEGLRAWASGNGNGGSDSENDNEVFSASTSGSQEQTWLVLRSDAQQRAPATLIELHTHTTCSDGRLTPPQLVARAAQQGVCVLALSDHDSMAGVQQALAAGFELGVRIIPAVEISACTAPRFPLLALQALLAAFDVKVELGPYSPGPRVSFLCRGSSGTGHPVHILGYYGSGGPTRGAELAAALAGIREGRYARCQQMLQRLRRLGAAVAWERVLEIAGPGVAPGRVHLGQALVEAGHVASAREAFSKYLRDDGPAFAMGQELPAEEAVALVCRTGGVAVMAHPWSLACWEPLLERLQRVGLHGVEVYRDSASSACYGRVARERGLLCVGGSDFHGTGEPNERELGSSPLPPAAAHAFLRAAASIWDSALRERIAAFATSQGDDRDGQAGSSSSSRLGSSCLGEGADSSQHGSWFDTTSCRSEMWLSEWMPLRERTMAVREARKYALLCEAVAIGSRERLVLRKAALPQPCL